MSEQKRYTMTHHLTGETFTLGISARIDALNIIGAIDATYSTLYKKLEDDITPYLSAHFAYLLEIFKEFRMAVQQGSDITTEVASDFVTKLKARSEAISNPHIKEFPDEVKGLLSSFQEIRSNLHPQITDAQTEGNDTKGARLAKLLTRFSKMVFRS